MTGSRVLVKGGYCHWGTVAAKNKDKYKIQKPGFASPWFVVALFIALAGILYLYFINSSATKGYQIRQVEKDISQLKKENEQLRIKEAELKSLYYIEETSKQFNMSEAANISYIEEKSPVALK
ncbi:MAG: hypothetical protein NT136_02715 [Candidatus Moranbacteria bacterium]|nr:hypothetical protein [Candidatus Moranbacteria bacterium]